MSADAIGTQFQLEDVLREALDGMFVIDRNRRVVLFSAGCERITGYSAASVVGTQCRCHDVTECRDEQDRSLAGALCPSLQVFRGESPAARQRMSISGKSGQQVWVETSYSPMYGATGEVACVVGIMRDVMDIKQREDELRAAGRTVMTEQNETSAHTGEECTAELGGGSSQASSDAGDRPLDDVLADLEKREILAALRRARGQRTLAARFLRISRSRLYRRMEALGIDPRTVVPHEIV